MDKNDLKLIGFSTNFSMRQILRCIEDISILQNINVFILVILWRTDRLSIIDIGGVNILSLKILDY